MDITNNSNNILAILDSFTLDNPDDIMMQVAENFRKRRVEKNITRQRIAELSGVPLSTVARFEQKGLILILLQREISVGFLHHFIIRDARVAPSSSHKNHLKIIGA